MADNDIKVSVILSLSSSADQLRRSLDSVINQTLKEIEIICIDNSSSVSFSQILDEYKTNDSRVIILSPEGKTDPGTIRNSGKAVSRGEYLLFLDSEDYLYPSALEKLYNNSKDSNADICLCDAKQYRNNADQTFRCDHYLNHSQLPQIIPFNRSTAPKYILTLTCVAPFNKLFRRAFIEENDLYFRPVYCGNDIVFTESALCFAEAVTYVDSALVCHRESLECPPSAEGEALIHNLVEEWIRAESLLKEKNVFPERSFLNHFLSYIFSYLQFAETSWATFESVFDYLKKEVFTKLNIHERESGYYFPDWVKDCTSSMLQGTAEDFAVHFLRISNINLLQAQCSETTLRSDNKQLKSQKKSLTKRNHVLTQSVAFRIGRVITWLPRKIKGLKLKSKYKDLKKRIEYKLILPVIYRLNARKAIDEKLVLFADHKDRPLSDNMLPLYKKCEENGYHCEVFSGSEFENAPTKLKRSLALHRFNRRFIRHFARAKVVFLADYFPVIDAVKARHETQVVQLWHACGLGKRWGYAVTSANWGNSEKTKKEFPMYVNQTLACTSSSEPTICEGFREAFNCTPEVVQPLGIARTDCFFDPQYIENAKAKVKALFPEIGNRKIILFAPTFRGKTLTKSFFNIDLDFPSMQQELSSDYVIVTKLHPMTAKSNLQAVLEHEGPAFVFDASTLLTASEALCAADILITDYSSIMYEFMLFEKPIISLIPDLKKYNADRGLFLPYKDMAPGPYVYDQINLVESLKTVDEWFDPEKVRTYKKRFMSACDGHSTDRIYQYVFKNKESGGQ